MNIIEAIRDKELFRPYLAGDESSLTTWRPWLVALRAIYGLRITSKFGRKLIRKCTGRDPDRLPKNGFQTALLLTGRRSGKSRIAAVIGGYSAGLAGLESKLAVGEMGLVSIISPSKNQSRIVHSYMRSLFATPMLKHEVMSDVKHLGFELRNGNRIELLAGDFRKIRGFSQVATILDEVCFLGVDSDEIKVRSDVEIVRAIQPALATTGGKLIAISSPYAKRGWAYQQFIKHWGNDKSNVLVWRAPSRTMNSTLSQKIIDRAMAEDMAAAKSEYYAQFRDDISAFISRELVDALVVKGRTENLPRRSIQYSAFVDMSGGRHDGSALAIASKSQRKIVIDLARLWRSPLLNPYQIIAEMASILHHWGIAHVTGDAFGADFVSSAFAEHGIKYAKSEKNKSALYHELLPVLCSGEIELLDSEQLAKELAQLERRVRTGGKDVIDHPPGQHDDLANAVAGAAVMTSKKRLRAGGLFSTTNERSSI